MGESEREFYLGKIMACRYFMRYDLPRVAAPLALLSKLDDTALAMRDDWF